MLVHVIPLEGEPTSLSELAERCEVGYVLSMLLKQRSVQLAFVVILFRAGALSGASIGGVVLSKHGSPIPRARILLESPGTQRSRRTVADRSGKFLLLKLPAGDYTINVDAERYATREVSGLHVGHGVALQLPEIRLDGLDTGYFGCEFDRQSRVATIMSKIRRFVFGVRVHLGQTCP